MARRCGDALVDILPPSRKKSAIGFGSPPKPLRQKPQELHMVCGFFVRAAFLGGSDGRARALPVSLQGVFRSSNPFELPPLFGSGAAVLVSRNL